MKPLLLAVAAVAALSSLACCSAQEPRAPAGPDAAQGTPVAPERKKLEAPVDVSAELSEGKARVTVRFTSPVTGVRVGVSGVDGLVVQGDATLVDGASYDRGAVAAFDVALVQAPPGAQLAVVVSGTFGGVHLARVRSFPVGTPAPAPEKASGAKEAPAGDRVKVVVPRE